MAVSHAYKVFDLIPNNIWGPCSISCIIIDIFLLLLMIIHIMYGFI